MVREANDKMDAQMPNDIAFAHQSVHSVWIAGTPQMKRWNKIAVEREFNRSLTDEAIALLDYNGKHLVRCVLPIHTSMTGKITVRVFVMMKMKDKNEPETACLDISHADWRRFCQHADEVV